MRCNVDVHHHSQRLCRECSAQHGAAANVCVMRSQRKICYSIGAVGLQVWRQTQLFLGHPSGGACVGLGTSAVLNGVRETRAREWSKNRTNSWGTGGNMASVCGEGRLKEAVQLLDVMEQRGFWAYSETCARLLQGYAKTKALADVKGVHAHIIKSGFESNMFLANTLVSMYCKCGSIGDARRVFDKMPQRNAISWTAMIGGLAKQGQGEAAFELFRQMEREGVKADRVTFMSILNACAGPVDLEHGKRLHAGIITAGFESDVRVGNALVSMYCKCGSMADARQMFDRMPKRDVISWNAMIAGCAQQGHDEEAFGLFGQMQRGGVTADRVTFLSILSACSSPMALESGRHLHVSIMKAGLESDVGVGNALISMYCKCGSVVDGRRVFDSLRERDVVSWTAMIAGYSQHGDCEKSFELFRQMQSAGVKPNEVAFMSILNACASLAALEEGKWIHDLIVRSGLESDVRVSNALVDMYAKCGSVGDARQVFDKIPQRDVVSWNTMVVGYAQNGIGKEALQLFEQMLHEGVKPDSVTFVGVLSACNSMGLVDKGHSYFLSMSHDHGIPPTGMHYGCMVGLLGRSGQLHEAEDFISKMPVEPNASVWGPLLGACRIYGNVEVAERAAEHILKFKPQDAGVYVLLSNVYGAAGRWDDIAKVRKAMKDRGVKKEPGRSWIEVKNRVHTFGVEDRSHPQTEEIYAVLERLDRQIKEVGYVPNTRFVLHDVDQKMKEQALGYHSEKLAIVFGLISTPPGTPICIIKNLRVCGDCHTTSKFISTIVGCEIIARDANRFHHFKNGVCSCGDYW